MSISSNCNACTNYDSSANYWLASQGKKKVYPVPVQTQTPSYMDPQTAMQHVQQYHIQPRESPFYGADCSQDPDQADCQSCVACVNEAVTETFYYGYPLTYQRQNVYNTLGKTWGKQKPFSL